MKVEEIEKLKEDLLSNDKNKSIIASDELLNICTHHLNSIQSIAGDFDYVHINNYFEFLGELTLINFNKKFITLNYYFDDEFIGVHERTIKVYYNDLIDFDYKALYNKYKTKRIESYNNKIKLLKKNISYYDSRILEFQERNPEFN